MAVENTSSVMQTHTNLVGAWKWKIFLSTKVFQIVYVLHVLKKNESEASDQVFNAPYNYKSGASTPTNYCLTNRLSRSFWAYTGK